MKQTSTSLFMVLIRKLSLLIILLGISMTSYAQQRVTGTVTDPNGDPVVGANVIVEGTTNGTTTGVNGQFVISVPAKSRLVISFIGYKDEMITVNGQTDLAISLTEDAALLDDVVVVGYGMVKKRDLTGAVASVKSADITIAPTSNAMEALQGRVAGLDIWRGSGEIGSGVSVLLRGYRSIYGSNSPLFIIDGFSGSYDQVNPSDIESIDVLKDASSTAIYGSAGANGVVIITTKRGKTGKATVSFDAYYGVSGQPNYKHARTGEDYMQFNREAYKYQYGAYPENDEVLFGNNTVYQAYLDGKWIDWIGELTGNTAVTQKYNISVTGGTEKTKIFSSISYTNDTGLIGSENRDHYALRLNVDQDLVRGFAKMGVTTNITFTDRDRAYNKMYTNSLSALPLGDPYNEDGSIRHEFIQGKYSPLSDMISNQYANSSKQMYMNANAYLEILPVKGLSLKTQVSTNLSASRTGLYYGEQANANLPTYAKAPWAQKSHSEGWGYKWENIIAYNTTLAEDHNLGFSAISSWSKSQSESSILGATGQMVDGWLFHQMLSTSTDGRYMDSGFSQTQQMSFALRLNYSYKGKYLVSFSNRWDGVSWFMPGSKWDSFPAAAVAWRISDEHFMQGSKSWLDNLKFRVGYGITGNSGGVGAYATVPTITQWSSAGVSVNGDAVPFTQYVSPFGGNLSWEKSYNWNAGIDFSLFGGRIDGSIDYFDTKTRGLLFQRAIPITSGLTEWGRELNMWQNLAKTSNYGFEATINTRNIQKKSFSWNSALTFTWNKGKIDALPEGDIIDSSLFVGQPIKTVYGLKYLGIWGTDTPQEILDAYAVKPGFAKLATVPKIADDGTSDDGIHPYSNDDRMILGHAEPDYIIGFNNTFYWKNFDLTVYAMARLGQTINSAMLGNFDSLAGVEYWTEENQVAYFPAPGSGSGQTGRSSMTIVDGSFIKIKNITLGYTLPKQWTRKALMENVRVYATIYNPYIYAFHKQLRKFNADPETGGSNVFPTYKQFVFGLNITF